jgi:hypothetical protein
MIAPMRLLFVASVTAGRFMRWFYFPSVAIFLPTPVKISVLLVLVSLALLVFYLNSVRDLFRVSYHMKVVYYRGSMWFLPMLSTLLFIPLIKFGESLIKVFDQGWLEQLGGQGFIKQVTGYSARLDYFFILDLRAYLLGFFFILVFVYMGVYLLSSNRALHWRCRGNVALVDILQKYLFIVTMKMWCFF